MSSSYRRRRSSDCGFSLIEILVVVVIIGVLAAIAIPNYLSQRNRAVEAGEKADAHALATQLETYYADAHRYPAAGELTWSGATRAVEFGGTGGVVRLSPNNEARILGGGAAQGLCVEVRNVVAGTTAVYEAGAGGLREVGAGAACPAAYDTTVLDYPAA